MGRQPGPHIKLVANGVWLSVAAASFNYRKPCGDGGQSGDSQVSTTYSSPHQILLLMYS